MVSPHCLKTLTEIISDDILGPALYTLVIGTDYLTDDLPLEDLLPFQLSIRHTPHHKELHIYESNYG
jgi:hypothetical protein